ncbi:hypothetical protein BJ912DRAFT_953750 [Pholiota molesta]|nr:hypothetical protein BJ912DRAFT_953750 [Pholiota molesta]
MSSIFRTIYALRSIFRASRDLPWEQVPPVIYHQLALNVMMVSSIVEYTWDFSGLSSRNKVVPEEQAETLDSEDEALPMYLADRVRMQPFAMKVFFSGVYVISGAGFIVYLLAQRARVLRTVTLARPGSGPNAKRSGTLYFQTAVHPAGYGIAFPINDVSIVRTDIPSKFILRVTGLGGWELNVNGATINGKTMPKNKIDDSRVAMLRAWNAIGGRVGIPKAKT